MRLRSAGNNWTAQIKGSNLTTVMATPFFRSSSSSPEIPRCRPAGADGPFNFEVSEDGLAGLALIDRAAPVGG